MSIGDILFGFAFGALLPFGLVWLHVAWIHRKRGRA